MISPARLATAGGIAAGAVVTSRMWFRWRFSNGMYVRDLAVDPARRHDRDLRLQADELLDDRFLVADRGPDVLDVGRRGHLVLALAVVAEGRRS